MYLNSIHIKNFKLVEDSKFTFGKINVITSGNFTGKSSVLESIAYVFTDHLKAKISDYVRWGEKKFEISALFHNNKEQFLYNITGSKGAEKSLRISNGTQEEFVNSDATRKMMEYISPPLTLYSSISLQEKAIEIIFDRPSDRLARLKSILGMDTIERAVDTLSNQAKDKKDIISVLKSEIQTLSAFVYQFQEVPEVEDITDIDKKYQAILLVSKDLEVRTGKLKQELAEIEKEEIRHENNIKEYRTYTKRVSELSAKQASLEMARDNIEFVEIKGEKEAFTKEIDRLIEEKSHMENEIKDLEKKKKLKEQGKCYVCEGDLSHMPEVEDFEEKIRKFSKLLSTTKESITTTKESLEECLKLTTENARRAEQLRGIESQLTNLKKERLALKEVIEPEAKEFLQLKDNVTKHMEDIFNAFDYDEFDRLKKALNIHEQKLLEKKRIEAYNHKLKKQKQDNEETIGEKQTLLESEASQLKIIEDTKSLIDKDFSSLLLEQGLKQIEKKLNDFFAVMNPERKVYLKRDKKNLEFMYSDAGSTVVAPVEMLSGMESQIMALGFRVALTSLQNFGIFVLDEIDSWADSDNSISLFDNFLRFPFEQLFIVSHKQSTVEHLANNYNACVFDMESA